MDESLDKRIEKLRRKGNGLKLLCDHPRNQVPGVSVYREVLTSLVQWGKLEVSKLRPDIGNGNAEFLVMEAERYFGSALKYYFLVQKNPEFAKGEKFSKDGYFGNREMYAGQDMSHLIGYVNDCNRRLEKAKERVA